MKLLRIKGYGYSHWCPACGELHMFAVDKQNASNAKWNFDGNMELPTFSPSMNIRTGPYPYEEDEAPRIDVCHYFLTNGIIQYLSDCTHSMKGQNVPLRDLSERNINGLPG